MTSGRDELGAGATTLPFCQDSFTSSKRGEEEEETEEEEAIIDE